MQKKISKRVEAEELLKDSLPALITGGAGDDPAGILTYTMVGATSGFSQLWLLLLSTPMLVAANTMAAQIAVSARDGIAAVIRKRYGKSVSFVIVLLLAIANLATIAADTAGIASAMQIITGIRWEIFVPFIIGLLLLILKRGYTQVKKILVSLTAVLIAYVIAALISKPNWYGVLSSTLIPHVMMNKTWLIASLGLLGTTISPYLLFWQAGEEIEELQEGIIIQVDKMDKGVWLGMIYSNLIAFFIIIAAAVTIHSKGLEIQSVLDAEKALIPLGRIGMAVFIIGFIASGFLALPVLAGSTAYAVAELMNWPEGFGASPAHALGFFIVLIGTLLGGAVISLLPNFNPADALYYSQVLDGILLPVLILILLVLSNDRQIVGEKKIPSWMNFFAILTILLSLAADFAALISH